MHRLLLPTVTWLVPREYFSANSSTLKYGEESVYVTMIPNPSHLEVCNAE